MRIIKYSPPFHNHFLSVNRSTILFFRKHDIRIFYFPISFFLFQSIFLLSLLFHAFFSLHLSFVLHFVFSYLSFSFPFHSRTSSLHIPVPKLSLPLIHFFFNHLPFQIDLISLLVPYYTLFSLLTLITSNSIVHQCVLLRPLKVFILVITTTKNGFKK